MAPEEAQRQLQRLLAAFPVEEARRMKARAFWQERRRRRKASARRAGGDEAMCPISLVPHSQIEKPCVASDGFIYEAEALEMWAQRNPSSPITRAPLRFGVPLSALEQAKSAQLALSTKTARGRKGNASTLPARRVPSALPGR